MASPQLVLALTQPPAHEGGAPGRCSVGLMLGLLEHGISVRAVAAHGSEYPPEAVAKLPERLPERIEFVAIPPWAPTIRHQLNRVRRPIGRLASGEFLARVRALAAQADLLHLEQLETAWCADDRSPPSVVHLHYRVQMDRRPPAPWRKDFRFFAERALAERLVARRQQHLVASSPLVADSLRREHAGSNVVVAPLCLDPQHYLAAPLGDSPVIGIIGTGWWPPTASAIRRLVSRTWPLIRARRPDARLLVAGRGTADLGLPPTPGVEVLGSVQSGAEFIRSLSALVYPLDRGSGMKVKVLEAIASGVPVVTTGPGAEGIAVSDGVVIRVTDEQLANETSELLRDGVARRERGAAARASFLRHLRPSRWSSCTGGWSRPGESAVRLLAYTDAVEYGGAEQALANLVGSLRDDIEVTVAGVERGIVEAVAGTRPRAATAVVPSATSLAAHRRLIRLARPDVMQVNMRTPYSCTASLAAATLTAGLRTVAVEHLPLASSSRSRRWLKRQLSRRLAAHVSVSELAAREIEAEAGLPSRSIRTIHNGVPPRAAVPPRAPNAPAAVAVIGRLDRQKGIDVLLDALLDVPDVSVLVVGDGPERRSLAAYAERLGLQRRVAFVGWEDDVHARLGQVDALILPSRNEALPLVVLESMLAGVPVLATDVGGLRECIEHGRTGLLVPPNDAGALAVELRRLAGDPALRTRLAAAAAKHALARFTAGAMAAAYERLYAEIGAQ